MKHFNTSTIGMLGILVLLGISLLIWLTPFEANESFTTPPEEDTSNRDVVVSDNKFKKLRTEDATGIYNGSQEHALLSDKVQACNDYMGRTGAPLKAYLEREPEVCSNSSYAECERNYFLYKMVADDFSNCEAIETEKERKMCEIMQKKDEEECSKMEEVFQEPDMPEELCLSIVKDDISQCEELGPYGKRGCWFGYYLYKSKNDGAEKCDGLLDFPTQEAINATDFIIENYYDFSPVHMQDLQHQCKAFALGNFTVFEDYFKEKCGLENVVSTVNPLACELEIKEDFKCKERINNLVECLKSDKTIKAKKECVDVYANRDFFCKNYYAKDVEGVKELLPTDRGKRFLKRDHLIEMEPQLCVI